MTEQTPGKLLTITHDGKLYVSSYGSLQLGESSLSDIVSEALGLGKNEYQELNAEVVMTIKFKDMHPKAWWNDADGE